MTQTGHSRAGRDTRTCTSHSFFIMPTTTPLPLWDQVVFKLCINGQPVKCNADAITEYEHTPLVSFHAQHQGLSITRSVLGLDTPTLNPVAAPLLPRRWYYRVERIKVVDKAEVSCIDRVVLFQISYQTVKQWHTTVWQKTTSSYSFAQFFNPNTTSASCPIFSQWFADFP